MTDGDTLLRQKGRRGRREGRTDSRSRVSKRGRDLQASIAAGVRTVFPGGGGGDTKEKGPGKKREQRNVGAQILVEKSLPCPQKVKKDRRNRETGGYQRKKRGKGWRGEGARGEGKEHGCSIMINRVTEGEKKRRIQAIFRRKKRPIRGGGRGWRKKEENDKVT